MNIVAELEVHAGEELQHALILAKQTIKQAAARLGISISTVERFLG